MNGKDHKVQLRIRRGVDPPGDEERTVPASHSRSRADDDMHPSMVRRVTERRVAHILLRSPGLSRVELARQTGLSVATIGKIIDNFESAGIVEKIAAETSQPGPRLGRPAEYYSLGRSRRRYVVVELGVQKTQLAALPIAGPIGDIETAHFRTTSDFKLLGKRLKAAVGMLDIEDPLAVLVSAPGVVDEAKQRVLYSPNLHWTEGSKLFEVIGGAISSRIVVVQEIRALALGYLAHSDPNDSYLLFDTGDGVGGALVVEGQLQTGPLPVSAEVGHSPIPGNLRSCGCGGVGCLETLLTRRGLLRTAQRHYKHELRGWAQLVSEVTSSELPDWLQSTLQDTARVIAVALNTAGVSKVVLIGDLLELGPAVLEHLTTSINAFALWGRFGNIRVESAPKQRLLGLACAALDRVVLAPRASEESVRNQA